MFLLDFVVAPIGRRFGIRMTGLIGECGLRCGGAGDEDATTAGRTETPIGRRGRRTAEPPAPRATNWSNELNPGGRN